MNINNLPPGPITMDDFSILAKSLWMARDREGVYVEIGSLIGRSSVVIANEARWNRSKLYCIDVWDSGKWDDVAKEIGAAASKYPARPANVYKQFCENINKHGLSDTVEAMIERSDVAIKTWALPIRFIFIDVCHEYSFVKNDAMWGKFLAVGGIIVFHDYHSSWPGVVRAVNEVLLNNKCFQVILHGSQTIAFQRIGMEGAS